jgi:membrane protein
MCWFCGRKVAPMEPVGEYLIGLYLRQSSVTSMLGAGGFLVVLLVWIYYSSQIVLFGAEFTHVYANYRKTYPGHE